MSTFLNILAIIGSLVGGLFLVGAFVEDSAPKQAASAAIAVAFAVIPYCIARAFSALLTSETVEELRRMNETLAAQTKLLASLANVPETVEAAGTESEPAESAVIEASESE